MNVETAHLHNAWRIWIDVEGQRDLILGEGCDQSRSKSEGKAYAPKPY